MARLTDHLDMTIADYQGHKITTTRTDTIDFHTCPIHQINTLKAKLIAFICFGVKVFIGVNLEILYRFKIANKDAFTRALLSLDLTFMLTKRSNILYYLYVLEHFYALFDVQI